jgi:hypothetical protein
MDYVMEISRMRDTLHKEIIGTMITDNRLEKDEYLITFNHPVECTVIYYRPTMNEGTENVIITGIDGVSNELMAVNEDNDDRFVFYSDLRMEDLALIHRIVMTKNYTIKQFQLC